MKHLNVRVAQKRLELEQKLLPDRVAELRDILGAQTAAHYQVVWSSFDNENQLNFVDNVSCHRVSMALRCIFGETKDKLAKNLRLIRLANGPKSITWAEPGVLSIVSE